MTYLAECWEPRRAGALLPSRLRIRAFPDSSALHAFLNRSDNALQWRVCTRDGIPRAGRYACVGGAWRNVKNLDPVTLAHV